jgi:beta-N-acetylhexosaminidase
MFEQISHQLPTYSSFWLQQILRQQLGFGGLIFSDDLSMKGAGADDDMSTKSVMALNAGCDMVLVCNDKDNARRVADRLGQKFPCDQARLLSMRAGANRRNDLVGLERMVDTLA